MQGDYQASIKLYKDKNFLQTILNNDKPLKMNDRIYIKVETTASNVKLKVSLEN